MSNNESFETYSPNLSAARKVVRKCTREDKDNDNGCQCVDSLHAESLFEDVEERIARGMIDCAFDVNDDEQVADQEDHGNHTTEEVRADHRRRDSTSSVLMTKSAKNESFEKYSCILAYLDLFAHVRSSI